MKILCQLVKCSDLAYNALCTTPRVLPAHSPTRSLRTEKLLMPVVAVTRDDLIADRPNTLECCVLLDTSAELS